MPLYDYRCIQCDILEKDVLFLNWKQSREPRYCDKCGSSMEMVFSSMKVVPDVFPADGIYLEHVSAEGKRFYSKKEMRDYEKKHDMNIGMLH